eukprot:2004405-Lingulodinium_polyedra.AAC.1
MLSSIPVCPPLDLECGLLAYELCSHIQHALGVSVAKHAAYILASVLRGTRPRRVRFWRNNKRQFVFARQDAMARASGRNEIMLLFVNKNHQRPSTNPY